MTNAQFVQTQKTFITACQWAQVLPTTRQAASYRQGKGAAYSAATQRGTLASDALATYRRQFGVWK